MNASPDMAGQISVQLLHQAGRVRTVRIRSTRPKNTAAMFVGREPGEVTALIGTVFSLCGKAQTIAALMAMEDALGLQATQAQKSARDALRLAEMLTQTMMRMCIGWPRLMGLAQDPATVRRCLMAELALELALFGKSDWKKPGGEAMAADIMAAHAVVREVRDCINELLRKDRLTDAMQGWLREHDLQGFGALAPDSNPEQGALMRQWSTPLVRETCAKHGAGLAARLVAGQCDLGAIAGALDQILREPGSDETKAMPVPDGQGTAQVETVRGTLYHRVSLQNGRVKRYQIDAPTEVNFRPDGTVSKGLRGADATDIPALKRAAELHVLAVDPCVEADIEIEHA